MENWQALVEDHGASRAKSDETDRRLSEIEGLARTALERLIKRDEAGTGSAAGSALFNSLQVGAAICDATGKILQSNEQAQKELDLRRGDNVRDASLALDDGTPISNAMLGSKGPSDLNIVQGARRDGATVNLAILNVNNTDGADEFLVVFMDTPWSEEAQGLLAARFGLTEAETEILGAFATGVSLKQIAANRGRSYATIRNQFQAILEKTGCPNQADLLRLLLGTSYLFSQIQFLTVATENPLGKQIEMARPGGRFFDVQLFGDSQGRPFLCLPGIFGLPVTPAIEAQLIDRKLLMIGVGRPGFGGTSRPIDNQDVFECLAQDIAGLLDSMGIKSCALMGRASASRSVVNVARLIPDRLTHCVLVNALVPRPYVEATRVASSWTRSLMLATARSRSFAALILSGGQKLLTRLGPERFFRGMYRRSAADQRAASDPDVANGLMRGVEYVSRNGLWAGSQDILDGFQDWRDDVTAIHVPLLMLHGHDDPHVPIDAVRAFAKDFPERVDLEEVPDGGGLLNYTHPERVFDLVSRTDL